jgi:hypothetical protein
MLFSNPLGDQLSGSPEVPNWSKDTVMRMKGMRGDSFFFFRGFVSDHSWLVVSKFQT